jgi:hypothetical protein
MTNYTEENQKAEFIGGAIAGGCALVVLAIVVLFVVYSVIVSSM